MTTRDTGHSRQELRERLQDRADQQPLTTSCAHCDWTYTGTAHEGRELAKGHRRVHHPEIKPARRRRQTLTRFKLQDDVFRTEGLVRARRVAEALARLEDAS